MKFPFLASVVIFLLVLHHNLNKSKKIGKRQKDSYWKKEYEANTARKQPMDDLVFLSFPAEDFFPGRFGCFLFRIFHERVPCCSV